LTVIVLDPNIERDIGGDWAAACGIVLDAFDEMCGRPRSRFTELIGGPKADLTAQPKKSLSLVLLKGASSFEEFEEIESSIHKLIFDFAQSQDANWLKSDTVRGGLIQQGLGLIVTTLDGSDLYKPCVALLMGASASESLLKPGPARQIETLTTVLNQIVAQRAKEARRRGARSLGGLPILPSWTASWSLTGPAKTAPLRRPYLHLFSASNDTAHLRDLRELIEAQLAMPERDGRHRVTLGEAGGETGLPPATDILAVTLIEGESSAPQGSSLRGERQALERVTIYFAPVREDAGYFDYQRSGGEAVITIRCRPSGRTHWEAFFSLCFLAPIEAKS
jgi:hypothetical protein